MAEKYPRMRADLSLNDMVGGELPAHMWIALLSAYVNSEWDCAPMRALCTQVQEKLYDPLWLKEHQAAMQQAADEHTAHMQQFLGQTPPSITGLLGGPPPETEEGEGT